MTSALLPGSPHAIPHSGPDPWLVRIVLRRTFAGGILVPGSDVELMAAELTPETIAQLGGPANLRDAFDADRRRMANAARAAGYGTGYAVVLDVSRGRRRRLFSGIALPAPGGAPDGI